MNQENSILIDQLGAVGWTVRRNAFPIPVPQKVSDRYGWLPVEITDFIGSLALAVSQSERSWFVTSDELLEATDSAFKWNQWELDSLIAAEGDDEWQRNIRAFWDDCFPLVISVDGDYSFVGIQRRSHGHMIVGGREPEFEETEVVADGIAGLVMGIVAGDARIASYL